MLGMEKQKLIVKGIIYCPYGSDKRKVEKELHNYFSKYHVVGEWFKLNEDIICNFLDEYIGYELPMWSFNGIFATISKDKNYEGLSPKIIEDNINAIFSEMMIKYNKNGWKPEKAMMLCELSQFIHKDELLNGIKDYALKDIEEILLENISDILDKVIDEKTICVVKM